MLAMIHGVVLTVCCITMMLAFLGMFTSSKTVIEFGVRYSVIAFAFTLIIVVGVTFEKLFQAVSSASDDRKSRGRTFHLVKISFLIL